MIAIVSAKSGWGKTKFLSLIVRGIAVGEKKKQILIIDPTNEWAYDNKITESLVNNVDEIGFLALSGRATIPLLDNSVIVLRLRDDIGLDKKSQFEGIISSINGMAENDENNVKKFLIIDDYQGLLAKANSMGMNPDFSERLWLAIKKFSKTGEVIIATQTLRVFPTKDLIDANLYLGKLPKAELETINPEFAQKLNGVRPGTFYNVSSGSLIKTIQGDK